MTHSPTYRDYTGNVQVQQQYFRFQEQWRDNIPESEKVLIELVLAAAKGTEAGERIALLDVGCSTGNFLLHLKQRLPHADLHGIDLAVNVIERNQADPALSGISFARQDMLRLESDRRFDILTCNKTLPFFPEDQFDSIIGNFARVLNHGGSLIIFDWFHRFRQDLEIIDRCEPHPYGIRFFVRSYDFVSRYLEKHGFNEIEFTPFEIPVDLPAPTDPSDVSTFTVRSDTGQRLQFRGGMYQPWCFTTARLARS
jgi:ubiquinone/menaquinone biosynthesis C-methylase UbiE